MSAALAHGRVAAALDRLDEDGLSAESPSAFAQAHDDVGGPEGLAKFFPSDHDPRTRQQEREGSERQILHTDLDSITAEFASVEIACEHTEPVFGSPESGLNGDGPRTAI